MSFKQSVQEHELTKHGDTKVCLAADARWCYYIDSCLSLTNNFSAMRKVSVNDEADKLSSSIESLFYDSVFLKEVSGTIEILTTT